MATISFQQSIIWEINLKCIASDNFTKRKVSYRIFTVLVSDLAYLLVHFWYKGDIVCLYQIHLLLKTKLWSVNDDTESES